MTFETLRHGKGLYITHSPSCVPDYETLQSMRAAGLTFRLDGKPWRLTRAAYEELTDKKGD